MTEISLKNGFKHSKIEQRMKGYACSHIHHCNCPYVQEIDAQLCRTPVNGYFITSMAVW